MEFEQRPLDTALIGDLLSRRDPIGYLSVYVDADPSVQARPRPPWHIEVTNGLRDVRALADEASRDESITLRAALDEFERLFEHELSAAASGRGRAWFMPVRGGDGVMVGVQTEWPTTVRL
jgi:hypothetical protein